MSAWAYCDDDDCNHPIAIGDYDIEDVINQEYACKSCGLIQGVKYYTLSDLLKHFNERLIELEKKS